MSGDEVAVLRAVEQRVLWLATSIVHHANKIRPNSSGVKVGGHQASSASIVSIMTALWFGSLQPADRVSVKPHAGPVLHAINYLLGDLDESYLTTLRAYQGLQPYPSRTKDPDTVDYSTGSVGIGATAPIWGAIARRYVDDHFGGSSNGGRQISLLGDAELDEGACWEAICEPSVAELGEVLWVVDLNRQSLDRIVPSIAADKLEHMFTAAGWQTITLKYGRRLRELFRRDGGELLRERIDGMSNPEYQRLLRLSAEELRDRLPDGRHGVHLGRLLGDLDDADLRGAIRDLGGHDLADLLAAFDRVDRSRPTIVFAYTIKGYGLPSEGHPANHSALLTPEQIDQLAAAVGADPARPWERFAADSAEARLAGAAATRLKRPEITLAEPAAVPTETGRRHTGRGSTQAALGRLLMDLSRGAPDLARRIVTVSPDVASSTNLGGWLNKVGVYAGIDQPDWFADDPETLMHWREHPRGQHIELGIAEVNLVGLLGELGATWSRWGQPLLPIGAIYDPFVNRALEPWLYGNYAGGQSILIGTPSGITLSSEGGAHQSIITPSVGLEAPGVVAYEPAFAQDFEWCFLSALRGIGRPGGHSAYFRLSTLPVDQALADVPAEEDARERRRQQAIAGGYVLRAAASPDLTIAAVGAVLPQAVAAVDELAASGVAARLVCVTSADLVFRAVRAGEAWVRELVAPDLPLVTVLDGHPHTLAFLGGGPPAAHLGTTEFGQTGSVEEVYRHHGIDTAAIVAAAVGGLLDS